MRGRVLVLGVPIDFTSFPKMYLLCLELFQQCDICCLPLIIGLNASFQESMHV